MGKSTISMTRGSSFVQDDSANHGNHITSHRRERAGTEGVKDDILQAAAKDTEKTPQQRTNAVQTWGVSLQMAIF